MQDRKKEEAGGQLTVVSVAGAHRFESDSLDTPLARMMSHDHPEMDGRRGGVYSLAHVIYMAAKQRRLGRNEERVLGK